MTIPEITEGLWVILSELDEIFIGHSVAILDGVDSSCECDAWKDGHGEIVVGFIRFQNRTITVDASCYHLGFFLEFKKEISTEDFSRVPFLRIQQGPLENIAKGGIVVIGVKREIRFDRGH